MTLKLLAELYLIVAAASLIPALLYWRRLQGTRIATLPFFILAVVAFDLVGLWRRRHGLQNSWINYIELPFVFLYIHYLYDKLLRNLRLRQVLWFMAALYVAVLVVDVLFYRNTYSRLYTRAYVTGAVGVLFCVVAFYYEMLNSDRVFGFYRQPEFWVSTGFLLFYLGTLPFHLTWNVASLRFMKAYTNTKTIFYYLLCCQYLFFLIAFLCLKPNRK